jgi:transposase
LDITKRGDRYLRMLLVHGARAAVRHAERRTDPGGVWINRLKARRGPNVAAVAVANKNARVAWKLLSTGQNYRPPQPPPNGQ